MTEDGPERDELPPGDRRWPHEPGRNRARPALYLALAAFLVVVAIAAVVLAARTNPSSLRPSVDTNHLPVGPAVPPINVTGWTNSPALGASDLAGHVVLYDFWTYSCINCVDTIPYLRSWYDRYRADGLVIVGIHTPEFTFEHNHANVERAVRDLGVTWPVAFDDNMKTWNAFLNNSWPADYVADRTGHIRYVSLGEGNYRPLEDVLRTLLGVPSDAPRAPAPKAGADTSSPSADITPETYLGTGQGKVARGGTAFYPDPAGVPVDHAALSGEWTATPQYVAAAGQTSAIVLHYQATEVNLVMAAPPGTSITVGVELDGKPLPPAYRTSQTVVGSDGSTSVLVTQPDLYRLVAGPGVEGHVLQVSAGGAGLLAYDFTFEP